MQLIHFLPKNELLKKYIKYYHITNYEQKHLKQHVVIYPHYLTSISIQDNFISNLSGNEFTFRELTPPSLNFNILGRTTQPLIAKVDGRIKGLSIVFKPLGINHFCDKSLSQLVPHIHNKFFEWDEKADELQELLYLDDFEQLIEKLEQILLWFYRPFSNEVLTKTLSLLHENFADYNVDELEKTLGVNRKTLLRQFKKHIGVSITDYRRIVRFREAIALHPENENLTRLAYESCFCDQSHLIKDFQKMAGESPKKVFKEAGFVNQTPFFLKVTNP
jgi:AraC-like DNA-binding protein